METATPCTPQNWFFISDRSSFIVHGPGGVTMHLPPKDPPESGMILFIEPPWLRFKVPRGCLRFVIVVFPDHNHLLFLRCKRSISWVLPAILDGFQGGHREKRQKWLNRVIWASCLLLCLLLWAEHLICVSDIKSLLYGLNAVYLRCSPLWSTFLHVSLIFRNSFNDFL